MQIIDNGEYYKPSKPQPKPKAQYYKPPKPQPQPKAPTKYYQPVAKKVLAQPVKPQMPPPTLPGQYPQPQSNIPDVVDLYTWDDLWSDIGNLWSGLGNWMRNWSFGSKPYQPPTREYYQLLSGEITPYQYRQIIKQPPAAPAAPPAANYGRGNISTPWASTLQMADTGQTEVRANVAAAFAQRNNQTPILTSQEWLGLNARDRAIEPLQFEDPYENGGWGTMANTLEPPPDNGGGDGGYDWGYGWGGGGGASSYGAPSGVNSYLPGTRAGYGANASSPRYTGGGGGRGSSYAGGQYNNQSAWRMPMLVWNI